MLSQWRNSRATNQLLSVSSAGVAWAVVAYIGFNLLAWYCHAKLDRECLPLLLLSLSPVALTVRRGAYQRALLGLRRESPTGSDHNEVPPEQLLFPTSFLSSKGLEGIT